MLNTSKTHDNKKIQHVLQFASSARLRLTLYNHHLISFEKLFSQKLIQIISTHSDSALITKNRSCHIHAKRKKFIKIPLLLTIIIIIVSTTRLFFLLLIACGKVQKDIQLTEHLRGHPHI